MPESARLPRLLAALSLTLPLLGAAQAPAMTDAERARRDAEKVLSFIKFQTVKTKPAAEQADKPRKPVPPSPQRQAVTARPAQAPAAPLPVAAAAAPPAAEPTSASVDTASAPAVEQAAARAPEQAAPSLALPTTSAPAAATAAVADPGTDTDAEEEVPLQMQYFVEPTLPRGAHAPFVGSTRTVTVRFTVETNGKVSKAEARADSPRRLARSATDAVLQWQFAPLAQPRTVDVEIAFKPG